MVVIVAVVGMVELNSEVIGLEVVVIVAMTVEETDVIDVLEEASIELELVDVVPFSKIRIN